MGLIPLDPEVEVHETDDRKYDSEFEFKHEYKKYNLDYIEIMGVARGSGLLFFLFSNGII